jgi:hypothetical protein
MEWRLSNTTLKRNEWRAQAIEVVNSVVIKQHISDFTFGKFFLFV